LVDIDAAAVETNISRRSTKLEAKRGDAPQHALVISVVFRAAGGSTNCNAEEVWLVSLDHGLCELWQRTLTALVPLRDEKLKPVNGTEAASMQKTEGLLAEAKVEASKAGAAPDESEFREKVTMISQHISGWSGTSTTMAKIDVYKVDGGLYKDILGENADKAVERHEWDAFLASSPFLHRVELLQRMEASLELIEGRKLEGMLDEADEIFAIIATLYAGGDHNVISRNELVNTNGFEFLAGFEDIDTNHDNAIELAEWQSFFRREVAKATHHAVAWLRLTLDTLNKNLARLATQEKTEREATSALLNEGKQVYIKAASQGCVPGMLTIDELAHANDGDATPFDGIETDHDGHVNLENWLDFLKAKHAEHGSFFNNASAHKGDAVLHDLLSRMRRGVDAEHAHEPGMRSITES